MGRTDVDAMLSEMTSVEFKTWMAYYSIEPFGEERADLRSAIVASTVANFSERRGRRRFRIRDFMPRFEKRSAQTPEQQYAMAMAYAHAHNASVQPRSGDAWQQ